jgi:hypothetical protein
MARLLGWHCYPAATLCFMLSISALVCYCQGLRNSVVSAMQSLHGRHADSLLAEWLSDLRPPQWLARVEPLKCQGMLWLARTPRADLCVAGISSGLAHPYL